MKTPQELEALILKSDSDAFVRLWTRLSVAVEKDYQPGGSVNEPLRGDENDRVIKKAMDEARKKGWNATPHASRDQRDGDERWLTLRPIQ